MDDATVGISRGPADTVLPEAPATWREELAAALGAPGPERPAALAGVAGRHPTYLDAWAALARTSPSPVEAYAYARVGYHRGLDALRASGWRGTGYVRYSHPTNRGFLDALESLRRRASELGEADEAQRCALFLRQLDPSWPPAELSG